MEEGCRPDPQLCSRGAQLTELDTGIAGHVADAPGELRLRRGELHGGDCATGTSRPISTISRGLAAPWSQLPARQSAATSTPGYAKRIGDPTNASRYSRRNVRNLPPARGLSSGSGIFEPRAMAGQTPPRVN